MAFDPRRPVRGSGPVPVTLIVSGVVLVVLIAAVAFLYRGGFKSPSDTNATVGAPLAQIKGPAPGDTAANEAAPGLTIYKTDSKGSPIPTNAAPAFVPEPEKPLPRAIAPKPITPVAGQGLKPATSQTVALAPPPPAAPVSAHVAPPPIPVKAQPKPAASGGAWVQIGAFSSTALAEKGWNDVARLKPGAMGGKGIQVENVDKDGHTMYRTFVTGFASHDAAQAFCNDLKAAGHACLVK